MNQGTERLFELISYRRLLYMAQGYRHKIAIFSRGGIYKPSLQAKILQNYQEVEFINNHYKLKYTWRLIDERVSTRQDPRYEKVDRRRLGKEIKESLAQDRRRRTEEAGAEVETMMKADPPLLQEAWHRLQGWYKAAVDRAPPPA